ncbi:MAG: alpha,alpha-trehalose-phosphate synthase (UDP-forming) [Candidatus Tectomicrobia bacterium]|nr:alpha,alpha-trehalose-phosphate synthase (UDP-forming) [Candidatus Tectomicrobia bacterium]
MEAPRRRLVVVSNRVPNFMEQEAGQGAGARQAGGLVSALVPALEETGGLWFGWSGQTTPQRSRTELRRWTDSSIELCMLDLSVEEVKRYYFGFSNRAIWPLFHGFPALMVLREEEYRAYRRVNRRFAEALISELRPDDDVWVHDYHLLQLGVELHNLGWEGCMGFFLHIPFPAPEIYATLPWARQFLEALLSYDLIGFHTKLYQKNFLETALLELGGGFDGTYLRTSQGVARVGVYPIGIEPERFWTWASTSEGIQRGITLRKSVNDRHIVIGVDRLDYTKGIPVRLQAFQRLLERFPSWRGKVCLVQISAPSRTDVPEYVQQKEQVDRLVGNINGRFSDHDWIPVRYLYRTFRQEELAAIYRVADVCLVTPLRDGMNLVAKEYIASQTREPGVLVLSRFCGAAEELTEALIVNPYDIDGTARALKEALEMPLRQRRKRWEALYKVVTTSTSQVWRNRYLTDLHSAHQERELRAP